jgi:hypothetical protein
MRLGEFITRSTVWISIFAYLLGTILLSRRRTYLARIFWTVACLALVSHFVAAFQFYHDWSQASAYRETAQQTNQVFGLNWGGGLFINYAVLLLWFADVGWWWMRGLNSYWRRSLLLLLAWHGFLIFIIFNATVVFKSDIQRWLGLAICLILCYCWWVIIKFKARSRQ